MADGILPSEVLPHEVCPFEKTYAESIPSVTRSMAEHAQIKLNHHLGVLLSDDAINKIIKKTEI